MSDLFFADLVRETTGTTGTVSLVLDGPTPGHRSFASVVPESEPFHYVIAGIAHEDEWEIGVGTIDGQGQLVRSALRSSDGATACDFSEGLKTVALTVASDWFAEQQSGSSLTIADIDGLTTALAGKQAAGDYADAGHGHVIADIGGLSSALDAKQDAGSYANMVHGHAIGDVTGLTDALDDKQDVGDYAAGTHMHGIDDISASPGQSFLAEDDRLLALTLSGEGREIDGGAVLAKRSAGGSFEFDSDLLVNGLTLGLGEGAVSTNAAFGTAALASNSNGEGNAAFGYNALTANTTGDFNMAVGRNSLKSNTVGSNNVAIGYNSLQANVGGNLNIGIGRETLRSNNAGVGNLALGFNALYSNTSGSTNIALGAEALYSNTTGDSNSAFGDEAMQYNTEGDENFALGYRALRFNTTGNSNVCIGRLSGLNLTTGSNNTIIGGWTGTAGLGNTIVLASGNSERFRITAGSARPASDNAMALGEASYRFSEVFAGTGAINTSDERVKRDIGAIPDSWLDAWGDVEWCRYRFVDGNRWHVGLIAQRVRDAFAAKGLDATEIGLLCYDEWDDYSEPEIGEDGEPTGEDVLIRPAGDRWGLRYEECLAMEAAWVRRELAQA